MLKLGTGAPGATFTSKNNSDVGFDPAANTLVVNIININVINIFLIIIKISPFCLKVSI